MFYNKFIRAKYPFFLLIMLTIHSAAFANDKFKLQDFAVPLEEVTSSPAHIWVTSGFTTVNPENHTVMGVNEFHAPPLSAKNFNLRINMVAGSALIPDNGSFGKGDVGLVYAEGTWLLHKIIRRGTYYHRKNGRLVSLGVTSELIPLPEQAGFVEKISIRNRTGSPLKISLIPEITPGNPSDIPLESWGFSTPFSNASKAIQSSMDTWSSNLANIKIYRENAETEIMPGQTAFSYFTILINRAGGKFPEKVDGKMLEEGALRAAEKRLATYTKNIPSLDSNINGLNDYYKRSLVSGMVCIWENPAYVLNPFLSTGGIDGGATCAYVWDIAGYVPQMSTLMLDSSIIKVAEKMAEIDLGKYYACTLSGAGVGVKYSYSPWSFTKLVSTIFKFLGPQKGLFESAKTLILNDEKQASGNHLIDYGLQHNLLEMRSTGWEHFVVSPNAERSWCLNQLSAMGNLISYPDQELQSWKDQANTITQSIQNELWDNKVKWFASVYPDGFRDFVYSIQTYDALRAGACTPEMEEALVSHLRNSAFLGDFGITSISKEDSLHYEVIDTDWSGGGAYTGDGPQLALIMYEKNKPDLAWNILQRHFWMGKHMVYYPQEHFTDKPLSPDHKRANIVSGLAGAETILFGLIGFQPQFDGQLFIHPQPPIKGELKIRGFIYRNNTFDVELSSLKMTIYKNGKICYRGKPKRTRIL